MLPISEQASQSIMFATSNPAAALVVAVESSEKYVLLEPLTSPIHMKTKNHCQIKMKTSQSRLAIGLKLSIVHDRAVSADRTPTPMAVI